MRTRLRARWRATRGINPGLAPFEFEFAHLLDAVSHVGTDVAPNAAVDLEPDAAADLVRDLVPDCLPEIEPDCLPEIEPDCLPEIGPEIVGSRFADAGLDDDRLPVTVKRRRGRRR